MSWPSALNWMMEMALCLSLIHIYRQIRRMCAELGYRVVTLKRVRIMNIHLGKLNTGDFRRVTPQELEELEWQLEQARMEREEADLPEEQDE